MAAGRTVGLRLLIPLATSESRRIALAFSADPRYCFAATKHSGVPRRMSLRFSAAAVAGIIMPTKLSTIEIDMSALEDALRQAEETLDEKHYAVLKAVVDAYDTIAELVDDKKTTIARLRKLLFGSQTEKTKAVVGHGKDFQSPPPAVTIASASEADTGDSTSAAEVEKSSRPGHGRNGADAYVGAEKVAVKYASLQAGDACPSCGDGTVYETGRPGVLVRLVGQAPIQATVYELQKLRCHLCGAVFTAPPPEALARRSTTRLRAR